LSRSSATTIKNVLYRRHQHVNVKTSNEAESSSAASKDNFDSYLSKLQNICTDNLASDEVKPGCGDAVKSALHNNFSAAMSTSI
jgi:hypothetical protein